MLKKIISLFTACVFSLLPVLTVNAVRTAVTGDINTNGKIEAADARSVLRFSVGLDVFNSDQLIIADTNEDGKINAADARNILRYSVGLEKPKKEYVTLPDTIDVPSEDIFDVEVPEAPAVSTVPDTFTFTVYGYGHGVGLSQYGALALEDYGYNYKDILSHYYTGTEVKFIDEFPVSVIYPTYEYNEEANKEMWVQKERDIEEILVRMVYQEIYGVTKGGKYKEALKAMTLCIFTNLVRFNFVVESRWDVGVAYEGSYDDIPENLKSLVREVLGQYITVKGSDAPILAVYSGLAAGMTASSESVWGAPYSYLTAVPSHFDMKNPIFIKQYTYTSSELKSIILAYDSTIILSDNPSEWIEIIEHTASMDENRGYVTKIRVGNKVLSGYNQFQFNMMGNRFISSCFTVDYTGV